MHTIAERADGARLIFDHDAQDARGESIVYAYIQLPDGTVFASQPLEQLLARGYWEAVGDNLLKSLVPGLRKFNENHDEHGRFSTGDGTGSNAGIVKGKNIADKVKLSDLPKPPGDDDHRDLQLEAIAKMQGFDAPAQTITKEELAKLDNPTILYRGISPYVDENGKKISGDNIQKEFISGKYFAGLGGSGNGSYWTDNPEVAKSYAEDNPDGRLITAVLDSAANVSSDEMRMDTFGKALSDKTYTGTSTTLALQGYDGTQGFNLGLKDTNIYVMFNRSAVKVVTD